MSLRIGALILGLLVLAGCINFAGGEWQGHEASRLTSSDGISDAVIVEGSAGATTGVTTMVFVVAAGAEFDPKSSVVDNDRAVFRADKVQDLSLNWTRADFLEIRFQKALVFHFNNFTDLGMDNNRHRIEIRLVPLDQASSLIPDDTANRSRK